METGVPARWEYRRRPPAPLPPTDIEHASTVGPVLPSGDQSPPRRILSHVRELLVIVRAISNLRVPTVFLKRTLQPWVQVSRNPFQEAGPAPNGWVFVNARRAEQMDVIRHDHGLADLPVCRLTKGISDSTVAWLVVQHMPALSGAQRHMENQRPTVAAQRRGMRGVTMEGTIGSGGLHGRMHITGCEDRQFWRRRSSAV
jgi:hypothetical protein